MPIIERSTLLPSAMRRSSASASDSERPSEYLPRSSSLEARMLAGTVFEISSSIDSTPTVLSIAGRSAARGPM